MNIKELIEYGKNVLKDNNIEDYSIIAKILTKHILELDDTGIIVNEEKEISEEEKIAYFLKLDELIEGKPIQYITNTQEFYGSSFYVNESVLIPQPDTEILVEETIKIIKENNFKNILDICTGSGCIGISIAKSIQDVNIIMTDISEDALDVTKINANRVLGNLSNIRIISSNMFEEIEEEVDVIVSNPPYIKAEDLKKLPKDVQNEPDLALDGGEDGLDFYRILIEESHKYLSDNGYLCLEIGYNQRNEVIELLNNNGNYKNIYVKKDLSRNDRIIIAQRG